MPKDVTKEILAILKHSRATTELIGEIKPHLKGKMLLVFEDNFGPSLAVRGDASIKTPFLASVNEKQHPLVQAMTAAHEFVHIWQYGTGLVTEHTNGSELVASEIPAKALEAVVYFELYDDVIKPAEGGLPPQQQQLIDITRDEAFDAALKPDTFIVAQFKTYWGRHCKGGKLTFADPIIKKMVKESPHWEATNKWLKLAKKLCPID
jgi:hypothetical protein